MENKKAEIERLTQIFRQAGATNPESWAISQIEEGIPQLALFSFAKALWEGVVDEGSTTWIDYLILRASQNPDKPNAPMGKALKEMRDKGIKDETIIDLVRGVQYEALFHTCSLLSGAIEANVPTQNWALFEVDQEGNPRAQLNGVHEILLSLDPTGREMRPKEGTG